MYGLVRMNQLHTDLKTIAAVVQPSSYANICIGPMHLASIQSHITALLQSCAGIALVKSAKPPQALRGTCAYRRLSSLTCENLRIQRFFMWSANESASPCKGTHNHQSNLGQPATPGKKMTAMHRLKHTAGSSLSRHEHHCGGIKTLWLADQGGESQGSFDHYKRHT